MNVWNAGQYGVCPRSKPEVGGVGGQEHTESQGGRYGLSGRAVRQPGGSGSRVVPGVGREATYLCGLRRGQLEDGVGPVHVARPDLGDRHEHLVSTVE